MSKKSKITKKTKRNYKSKARKPKRNVIRLFAWFVPGLLFGLFVPWFFYLQNIVNQQFVDYNYSIPSLIYARALSLYRGESLSINELKYELEVLGYRRKGIVNEIGDYSLVNNKFEIKTKGFTYFDHAEKPQHIVLKIANQQVSQLNTEIVRLEPLLIGQIYSKQFENRQPIKLTQVPRTMVMGLQAVEDRNFKHHVGIDFFGIIRAMVRNLFAGRIVQGGSTITQQLIKNRLHYKSKSWLRKANEAVVALMLEKKFNKGQILESYFNEIYWGQKGSFAIHGINQASQYYFSKKPMQLDIAQQALLIAMAKGPSWYHPIKQKERALKRRNTVLNAWYETSIINKQQLINAKNTDIELSINDAFTQAQYRDFIDLVKQQVSQSFSSAQLNQKGLKIFTTVNPFIQNNLNKTLQSQTPKLGKKLQSAAIVSDANSGKILAIKGSKDSHSFYNRALLSKRQIGSLIKPFVYLSALETLPSFDLSDDLQDSPLKIKTKNNEYWRPRNWDNKSLGAIPALEALVNSRNQATVYIGLKIGVKRFIKFLEKLGLTINRSTHPSIFLGATELTPLEVTNLFLILSSNAKQQHLLGVKSIVDKDNKLVGKINRRNTLSLRKQNIKQIKTAMHQVTTRGTAAKLTYHYGFKNLYGKTGTTNQGKNSWFVGFNNRYLATFWVAKDDNTPTHLSGGSGALVLWADWFENITYD